MRLGILRDSDDESSSSAHTRTDDIWNATANHATSGDVT